MPTHNELVAFERTDEQITQVIGADKVIFQTLDDLKKSVTDINKKLKKFDASCFDGIYVTGDINEKYLESLLSVSWNG